MSPLQWAYFTQGFVLVLAGVAAAAAATSVEPGRAQTRRAELILLALRYGGIALGIVTIAVSVWSFVMIGWAGVR